ncbi:hypothetical protein EVAR_46321_1 [Eumeta japonica]|uniref:Uncharacterized protein n=1 Tax=Eumeta variegata TaxID=151549 RepID=A0A4C1WYC0_EUMVA|nr:hypothetical protein EVAR_46321_1 [Eumeta japonica]
MDDREFRVVLREVPKEIPIEEVKEDLLTQDLPVQSVRRITNRAREPLDLVLVTANTGIDYETKRSFYRIKAAVLARLRGIYPKKINPPPPAQAAPRRAPARAVTQKLSYAKATAGPHTDPPPQTKTNSTPSENIKALMSVISIIEIGEVVLLANKFKAAANPVEKIQILAEHALLVEAIKNSRVAGYLSSVKILHFLRSKPKKKGGVQFECSGRRGSNKKEGSSPPQGDGIIHSSVRALGPNGRPRAPAPSALSTILLHIVFSVQTAAPLRPATLPALPTESPLRRHAPQRILIIHLFFRFEIAVFWKFITNFKNKAIFVKPLRSNRWLPNGVNEAICSEPRALAFPLQGTANPGRT